MTFKRYAYLLALVSMCAPLAHAHKPQTWDDTFGFDAGNDKAIENCLNNSENPNTCKELNLSNEGADWEDRASQSTAAWAAVGDRINQKAIKDHPDKAELINQSQTAWYAATRKECRYERVYKIYIGCMYGHTMDRVLELRSNTFN